MTGVTGYIAGDAFHLLHQKHPEYEYTVLVRSPENAAVVKKYYPLTQIVLGDLDDFELLKNQAAKADVVLRTEDTMHDRLGVSSDKIYNDWDGISELTSLPDDAFHRNVDKIVLESGSKASNIIKTVIIAPPTIYGNGRGPISGRGRQVYELAKLVLTKQYAPILGDGKARWNNVHVHDLSELYLLLTEAAVQGNADQELWGDRGYLIVENGEHVWSDLARAVGRAAVDLGYLQSCETTAFTKAPALETAGFEAVSWGLNSRARGCNGFKLAGLLGEMISDI